jgi:hypothetical protein
MDRFFDICAWRIECRERAQHFESGRRSRPKFAEMAADDYPGFAESECHSVLTVTFSPALLFRTITHPSVFKMFVHQKEIDL